MFKFFKTLALAGAVLSCASAAAAKTAGAFAEVPGGRLWYETCGSGTQNLVLVHEGGLDSATWDAVWPALCKTFRVIRYDRRGYGRSPETTAPFSQVADLEAVLKAAGARSTVVLGESGGAGIAVDFTLAHPDEVDRLVVVGPELTDLPHSKTYLEGQREVMRLRARGELLATVRLMQLFTPSDKADPERVVQLLNASPSDIHHKEPLLPPPPSTPRLGQIKAPTLIVVGSEDVADYQAEAGMLEYAVRGSRRVVVPNAAHLVFWEQPAEFADLVTRFVLGIPSPGTETALRRAIEGLHAGAPDYALYSPAMAEAVRANLERIKASQAALGRLTGLAYKRTTTDGADIFVTTYEMGSGEVRIMLGPDGRIYDLEPSPPQ